MHTIYVVDEPCLVKGGLMHDSKEWFTELWIHKIHESINRRNHIENGIRIFDITIRIYSNIRFGRSCLCRFGRSFLCPGTEQIWILVQSAQADMDRCSILFAKA